MIWRRLSRLFGTAWRIIRSRASFSRDSAERLGDRLYGAGARGGGVFGSSRRLVRPRYAALGDRPSAATVHLGQQSVVDEGSNAADGVLLKFGCAPVAAEPAAPTAAEAKTTRAYTEQLQAIFDTH